MKIIGRNAEISELERLRDSGRSEFVMVYGRRRVGKTFLIREFFHNEFAFQVTGIARGTRQEQLFNFDASLVRYGLDGLKPHSNWLDAFGALITLLEHNQSKRKVIFLDELPWMDTAKSDFVKALEWFWNSWASAREDILLIVCGSAASWLVKKIVRNHGGLHNRLTFRIKINPFTLNEVQQFLMNRGIQWEEDMIAECYMSLGGIPYYLDLLSPALSLAQNMDALFFNESPLLETEFQDLYASLFKSSGDHIKIVKALSAKRQGLTRNQIIEATGMSNGGSLTNRLDELEQCGFIRTYRSLGEATEIYQLIDFYTIFYFAFIHNKQFYDSDTWMHMMETPAYNTWCGLSFERLCLAHLPQMKRSLGIEGVSTQAMGFTSSKAQIDLVIIRGDKVVNLCEAKYTRRPFAFTAATAASIRNKMDVLRDTIKKRVLIQPVMITANGLTPNQHSINLIHRQVTLHDLFK